MRITFCIALIVSLVMWGLDLKGQTANQQEYDREARARIDVISSQLPDFDADNQAALKEWTGRLGGEIDRHIRAAVSLTERSDAIQTRLRAVLAGHVPNPESADLAFARMATLPAGQSLLVAYTIVVPPHFDVATIRGYRSMGDRFELVATTGDDFDGYNMFKKELRSPLPGELWLMAWGPAHTFNGRRIRFRMYAFDGDTLRTVWSPEDMFSAEVRFSASGFEIEHYIRPITYHDEYVITADGPVKALSR